MLYSKNIRSNLFQHQVIQRQVAKGSVNQGSVVRGERKVSTRRKRGMLDSSLNFGCAKNDWRSEAKVCCFDLLELLKLSYQKY